MDRFTAIGLEVATKGVYGPEKTRARVQLRGQGKTIKERREGPRVSIKPRKKCPGNHMKE